MGIRTGERKANKGKWGRGREGQGERLSLI